MAYPYDSSKVSFAQAKPATWLFLMKQIKIWNQARFVPGYWEVIGLVWVDKLPINYCKRSG